MLNKSIPYLHSSSLLEKHIAYFFEPLFFGVGGKARILEWVAIPFSRRSSQPRDCIQVSCKHFTVWATREVREASLVAQMVKHLPAMRETWVQSPGWEDLLEKEMATHSSILAWRIPGMEEPGRLQSMGSQRVGHDWATSLHFIAYLLLHYEVLQ